MRLIEDHILRKVRGNMVLIPVSDRETDFNGMVVLNHTGECLCRMLEHDTDRESLAMELVQQYEIEPERAAADVEAFLSELDALHLLMP